MRHPVCLAPMRANTFGPDAYAHPSAGVALPIQALRGNGEANAGCGFTERRRRAMLSERDKLQSKRSSIGWR